MQRILQINIAGRILPIEEDAYTLLKDYIGSLEKQFAGDDGKEIIEDIEYRIAELFAIRLQSGAPAIDRSDVQKVIDTLGAASDLHDGPASDNTKKQSSSGSYSQAGPGPGQQQYQYTHSRLLRNPFDKLVGGVCSGLAIYFDIDPVIIRLVLAILILTGGIGVIVYLIAWAVIPPARSMDELYNMNNGSPVTFHDITKNVGEELQDLKKRGEQMSKELRDFFSKKK